MYKQLIYLISVIAFVFTFSSCESREEISISEEVVTQVKNPVIEVVADKYSAVFTVKLDNEFHHYHWGNCWVYYKQKGSIGSYKYKILKPSYNDNYSLSCTIEGLSRATEYEYYIEFQSVRFIANNIPLEIEKFNTEVQTFRTSGYVFSSPIAVKGGFDTGWFQRDNDKDGNIWTSIADSETLQYGGSGYAAYMDDTADSSVDRDADDWLFSPEFYLEAGLKYTFSYRVKATGYANSNMDIYITQSADPEVIKMNSRNSYFYGLSSTYSQKSFEFTPKTSGKYRCAFCDINYLTSNTKKIYLTGFEVIEPY